jgi:hypothetical protein
MLATHVQRKGFNLHSVGLKRCWQAYREDPAQMRTRQAA